MDQGIEARVDGTAKKEMLGNTPIDAISDCRLLVWKQKTDLGQSGQHACRIYHHQDSAKNS